MTWHINFRNCSCGHS